MQARIIVPTGLLVAVGIAMAIGLEGLTEEAARIVVRFTAKLALTMLCIAFSASALRRLFPHPWTRALVRYRRGFGLSFALSHLTHLAALIMLGVFFPRPFLGELDALLLLGGGLAYFFLLALAITSTDAAQMRLGKKWRQLHLVGSWYILIIFTQSYVPRALVDIAYLPFVLMLAATVLLRVMAWRKKTRNR